MTFTTNDLNVFLEALAERPASRAQLRALLVRDELQTLNEQYDRLIQRRAPALFVNGDGGAPEQFTVQQRLTQLLRSLRAQEEYLTDEDDPFLADLIWWKGDHVIVVEASLQVDSNDVSRAARRAQTLQRAKAQATGVVIGEKWSTPETRQKAMQQAVEWKVGDNLSEGFVGLRRLAPGE